VTIKPIRAINFMQRGCLSVENANGSPLEASLTKKMKRHVSGFKNLRSGGPDMPVPCAAEFVAPQTQPHNLKRVSDRGSTSNVHAALQTEVNE